MDNNIKRSEAIRALEALLTGQPIRQDFAEQILDAVESIGMYPPPVRVHTELYLRDSGQYGWDEYIWEPE